MDPTTGLEIEISKQLRFEVYDNYKFDDFGLSRLMVESLLSPALMERITTRYNVDEQFETYPGQVLFMMALDTYNTLVLRDIAGTQQRYEDLSLDSFPAENITELATEALQLIYIYIYIYIYWQL